MFYLIPEFISKAYSSKIGNGSTDAFVLFVDIKGFTKITEDMMKDSVSGGEILSAILNDVFGNLIKAVYKNNGFVATFAGDAFTAVFENCSHESVFNCAKEMIDYILKNELKKTALGDFKIAIKIGVSRGNVKWGIVGSDENLTYYFKGEAIDGSAKAEEYASENEVIIDEKAAVYSNVRLLEKTKDGYHKLNLADFALSKNEFLETEIDKESVKLFFDISQMPERFSGEFRDVTSMFISFKEFDDHEKLNEFIKKIMDMNKLYMGYFNLLDFGDKGAKILILFGAPTSFENNVARAAEFAFNLKLAFKERIKIGITTGQVYAGYIGIPRRATYTVLGDKVNLSARIMGSASDGEILIDENTYNAILWKYRIIDKGIKKFKGKSDDVRIYRIAEKKEKNESAESAFENEIVGREDEIGKIESLIEKTILKGSFGGVINIFGEPGIGKTRLLFEIAQRNKNRAECIFFKNDDIYKKSLLPFEAFLKSYFNQHIYDDPAVNKKSFNDKLEELISKLNLNRKNDSSEDLISCTDALMGALNLIESDSVFNKLDPKLRFENIQYAIKSLIKSIAVVNPLIIFIEDLSWQDDDSNNTFKIIARNIENIPLIIITASRLRDDGTRVYIPFEDVENITDINLSVLSRDDTKNFISNQLIFSPSDELLNYLYERTEGNPFYVEQISLYLLENDMLEIKDELNNLKSDIEEMPHGINAILISRIDRLTKELKELVQNASVLGREFEIKILSLMISDKNVSEILFLGETEKIWIPLTHIKYIFKHGLMRDAAYKMQLRQRLKSLHIIAAEAMEKVFENDKTKSADIAYHYENGEERIKAKEYYLEAAKIARKDYKNYDAIKYYENGLRNADNHIEKIKIRHDIAYTFSITGEWKMSEKFYRELMDDIDKKLYAKEYADALTDYADVIQSLGEYDDAKMKFDETLSMYTQMNDLKGITNVSSHIAHIMWRQGEFDKSESLYEKIYANAIELKDDYLKTNILLVRGNICKDKGELDRSMEFYAEAKKCAEKLEFLFGLSGVLGNMSLVQMQLGNYKKAEEYLNEELEIAKKIGSKQILSYVYGNLGSLYFYMNDYERTYELYKKQLSISEEIGEKKTIRIVLNNLGGVSEMKGDYESEMTYFKRSLKIAEELKSKIGIRVVLSNIGNVYGIYGEFEKALEYFERSLLLANEIGEKRGIALVKHNIASALYHLKKYESSEHSIDEALKILKELNVKPNIPKSLSIKIDLLIEKGQYDEAISICDEGIEITESIKELVYDKIMLKAQKAMIIGKSDEETAVRMLEETKEMSCDPIDTAIVIYGLFEVTNGREYREEALRVYEELYSKYPRFEYADKIRKLQTKYIK